MKKTLFLLVFSSIIASSFAQKDIGLRLKPVEAPPQYAPQIVRAKLPIIAPIVPKMTPKSTPAPAAIPVVFRVETLPFFCKIEHKINVQQALPVKIRLGSVDYVDELEGKGKVKN